MTNTYIQDKLDAFRKFQEENGIFIKYLGEETQLKFTMYDDFLFQSLTDYHNYIVEKIKEQETVSITPETRLAEIESYKLGAKSMKQQILLSLLQDTNPKE